MLGVRRFPVQRSRSAFVKENHKKIAHFILDTFSIYNW